MLGYTKIGYGNIPVMVVHGWKTDHTCYESLYSSLNKDRYTYIFVDQRGYGKSINMPGPYNIPQVAKDMAELAEKLGFNKFHLVGHSMGGKVIQQIMADYSEKIISGVGIAPCPAAKIPFDPEPWQLFSSSDRDLESRLEIFKYSTGNRLTDSWYKSVTALSSVKSRTEAYRDYLDSWVNYDLVEKIQGCSIPIKVIVGEHDPDLNYEVMVNTFGVWCINSVIVVLQNCGHYPMLETPLSLAAEIERFLDDNQ